MEFDHKPGVMFDDEGLIAVADKEKKDWRGIVISLLVIGTFMSGIVVSIILCTPTTDSDAHKPKLELETIVSDQYKIQVFNGTWLSDHEIVHVDQSGSIVIFDADTNKSESMLVKTYDKTLHTMGDFKLSADRQSILFLSDRRYEFGAPVSARYAIFNISSQTVEFLDDIIKANYPSRQGPARIQHACWGPASNSILFIESNDIYYIPNFAQNSKHLRLTRTGSESVRNGLPDSLYRSTIFREEPEGEGATIWWSADGRYLSYLSFDDSLVEPSPIEYYESYMADTNNNPKIHYEKYPRAGTTNPLVSVRVVDLQSLSAASGAASSSSAASLDGDQVEQLTSVLAPPAELLRQQQSDPRLGHYVTFVGWLPSNQLLVMWSNRAQTSSMLSLCENANERGGSLFSSGAAQWRCDLLTTFSQRVPPSTESKRTILTAFNSNGTRLIFFALPRPDSVIGDHYHVAMLRGEERAPKYLTHGEFDIDRLISYDQRTDTLYFEVEISESAERHLYKMSSVTQIATRQTKCLTCNLEEPCGYNYVHISPNARYLVHECLGPSVPSTRMRSLNATDDRLESRYVLGENVNIDALIKSKQMPMEKFIAIKTSQQIPCEVYMKLYLPVEIEEEKEKRFPLLVESSEIDQRKVWKRFELDWGKYLASKKQVVYARIDCIRTRASGGPGGAGGGGSGASSGGVIGPGLVGGGAPGHYEEMVVDTPLINAKGQVDAIKFMLDNLSLFPYIDRRRVAIWGPSSAASYVALATTMKDDSKLIQCTIATSPITNWRYMSSYAAERYLGLPWLDSNNLKYERTNLLKRSYEFALRKLLIVHGTADEQVHVQHSMQFIKSLTEHHITGGTLHQMQLYPDVGHSFELVKRHYYLILDGFIDRCFYQKPISTKATEWKGKVKRPLYWS